MLWLALIAEVAWALAGSLLMGLTSAGHGEPAAAWTWLGGAVGIAAAGAIIQLGWRRR